MFYQLPAADIKFYNVTQTIIYQHVPEIRNCLNSIVCYYFLTDFEKMEA